MRLIVTSDPSLCSSRSLQSLVEHEDADSGASDVSGSEVYARYSTGGGDVCLRNDHVCPLASGILP
jgi:hypothetical protein